MAILTTKKIIVHLNKEERKLISATTKTVDPSNKIIPKKIQNKNSVGISTSTMSTAADIAEKKRRDAIMAERKAYLKSLEKKDGNNKRYKIETGTIIPGQEFDGTFDISDHQNLSPSNPIQKKPWKELSPEEKKAAYKERAKKATATRALKKENKK